ncbi:hypothetical protein CGCSCA4_v006697 [Colletotrichum siamense]|uniref:Uncharacterized protein n=1 Tax=Colletotrichum siamense TaxID=690259 RepID=A0A9P5EW06_COLSI|nr:uncharacterized protein CGCS363_v014100 [Colletotrichum siamense]KAF4845362.1 hypothetical protein CGCSCA4_v006697 [Colletotrichum siamense]KAF4860789.1 hypothetical protein CGCSCA2_v004985 [Colletotrichum siamense]KAF5484638.1 hypothetical protein CGCS363_v014100 [Colletotrichum siamense]
MAARGSLSDCRTPEEKAAARRKLERMMDPADAGNLEGIQKRRTTSAESREAGCAWEQQYYQGVSSSKFPGLGCGLYAFGTPRVPFQAPFTCDGRFEVMSGLGGPRSGSIRFCGPKDYWGVTKPPFPRLDAIFMLPFRHVVIIVPTGAVGASSVKREYPQIISFSWPDKAADKDLHSHEAANPEKDTYLFVFVRAMNDHLKPFNKAVIDLTSDTGRWSVIEQAAILSPPTDSRVKAKTRGQLCLMDQGILFNSQSHRVYLFFDSVEKAMTILAHDMKNEGKVAGLNLIFSATEPFYNAEEEETESQTLIKFVQVDHTLLDDIKNYMKQHRVELMLCEQSFYDYENDVPATGFMPMR